MPANHSSAVLLWDVMDTLVVDPFFEIVPRFFGMDLGRLLEEKHPTAWIEFEMGSLSSHEYYERMFADRRKFDHRTFEQAVKQAYTFVDGAEAVLRELSARRYSMHVLSNYPVWYKWIEDRLNLSRYVEWTFVSCKTKLRKPNAEAYLHAARTLGRKPEECLFVDDRITNCRAAEAVGMPAVVFENAAGLRRELADRGVLE